MAGQVNARLGTEDDADLTRCAAERGIERTTLAKELIREGLAAWREGRAVFDRPAELGPGDVAGMKAMLDHGLMEIDRIARDWAAHEAEVRKLERQDQLALTRARAEFIAGMPERIAATFNPIRKEMATLAERIEKQPRLDAIDMRLENTNEAITGYHEEVRQLAAEPRTTNVYNIGLGEWSRRRLAGAGFAAVASGAVVTMVVAWLLPHQWLAAPVSNLMLGGGDRASCALIEYQYRTSGCHAVSNDGGDVRVAIAVPGRAGPSGAGGRRP